MTPTTGNGVRERKGSRKAELVLGEDWLAADGLVDSELKAGRERRGLISLNRSPLARKIITFNLVAMLVLVAGVLYLNPFRNSLVAQRETGLVAEARLVADVFEAGLLQGGLGDVADPAVLDVPSIVRNLNLPDGMELLVFDTTGAKIAQAQGVARTEGVIGRQGEDDRAVIITEMLKKLWEGLSALISPGAKQVDPNQSEAAIRELLSGTLKGETHIRGGRGARGDTQFIVTAPIRQGGLVLGAIALNVKASEIDQLVRIEREQVLQMFLIAIVVSIGLSLVLASTIANPLSDLAAAAELGRDKNARKMSPNRVRIPDLTARPDEIGRLSGAMRGMVAALYDRIESNEQFAADVAHEIKNPLASLRSAVGTLRVAKRDDQRDKLLDVIEHDVRRLDRLVSDISNASRLDSELVKEEEETFNLLKMLGNITEYLGQEARQKGVDFIADLPPEPIMFTGLEGRLAQVFVNLITNAVSFCEDGDAVRVWARKRENRVLVVVEDTGPGIPDQALQKIFKRFYSERPPGQFGEHSGLGLAISKQIVEAHGGVIWAENIRPTDADITSDPLGARFVVGLPV
jgi:two-component system sensor histidine kinase ChvG